MLPVLAALIGLMIHITPKHMPTIMGLVIKVKFMIFTRMIYDTMAISYLSICLTSAIYNFNSYHNLTNEQLVKIVYILLVPLAITICLGLIEDHTLLNY
jgi:hypothetical protein